jgi:hypothetical protein
MKKFTCDKSFEKDGKNKRFLKSLGGGGGERGSKLRRENIFMIRFFKFKKQLTHHIQYGCKTTQ